MPSPKEYISPALSSTVCILLQTLKERLQQIQEQLCQAVLNSLWQSLAGKVNKLVYEEVSCVNVGLEVLCYIRKLVLPKVEILGIRLVSMQNWVNVLVQISARAYWRATIRGYYNGCVVFS